MTSIVRSVLVGLGATLALVVVPQPAHADQATLLDATGDSWASHPSGDWTQGSFANTDLRRTRVMHQHRRVVLDFTYVDLKAGASDEINLHAYLVTDKHVRYLVEVSVDYLGRSAHFGLYKGKDRLEKDCESLTGTTDFAKNTLRFRLGRDCLGDPQWIRFQGSAESYEEASGLFQDSANDGYRAPRSWTVKLPQGRTRPIA